MNELELSNQTALVPSGYAEKAMASLMQLHTELMEEKERRVDLYRRLMEKDQALAELRMYVKMLEEKAGAKKEPTPPPEAPAPVATASPHKVEPAVVRISPSPRMPLVQAMPPILPRPMPPPVPRRRPVATDGWKTW